MTQGTSRRGQGQAPRERTHGRLGWQWQANDHYPYVILLVQWLKAWLVPLIESLSPPASRRTPYTIPVLILIVLLAAILGARNVFAFIRRIEKNLVIRQVLGVEWLPSSTTPFRALWKWCRPSTMNRLLKKVVRTFMGWGLIRGRFLAFDPTYMHVYGRNYQGASMGKSGQLHITIMGYKVGIVIDLECMFPIALHVASGGTPDVKMAIPMLEKVRRTMGVVKGLVVVMDRGFHSQPLWRQMVKMYPGITLICRVRRGTKRFDELSETLADVASAVCQGYRCASAPVDGGQLVWIHRPDCDDPLVLWTNNPKLGPSAVYQCYRRRAKIERWIKDLKREWGWGRFPGQSWGAVLGHVYLTAIAFMVHRAFQYACSTKSHRWGIHRFRQQIYDVLDPLPLDVILGTHVPADRHRDHLQTLVHRLPCGQNTDGKTFFTIPAAITHEVPHAA